MTPTRAWAGFAIALVVVAVGYALYLVGSPSEARAQRLDRRRLEDLQMLKAAIGSFRTERGRLPAVLSEVKALPDALARLRDPVTKTEYGYRAIDDSSYELCADFGRAYSSDSLDARSDFWRHPQGHHCFQLRAAAPRK